MRSGRMQNWRTMFVAVTMATLCACSSGPKVRSDKDNSVNLANYKTFTWLPAATDSRSKAQRDATAKVEKAESGQNKPEPNATTRPVDSIVEARVHTALASVLQAKGYTASDDSADFRVSYVLNVYDRPKQSGMRLGLGAGGGSGNVGGGVGLSIPVGKRTETAAAMTIDIIDSQRNAQVWTGTLEQVIKGPALSDEDARSMVEKILEKYPTRSGK